MSPFVQLILEFGENLAIFIALMFVYGLALRYSKTLYSLKDSHRYLIIGTIFGLIAVVGMSAPIQVLPGIQIDGRNFVVLLASPFAGGWASLVAAAITGAYRMYIGGSGALPATVIIGACAVLGMVYAKKWSPGPDRIRAKHLFVLAVVILSFDMVGAIFIPDLPLQTIAFFMLPITAYTIVGTILLGLMLAYEYRRIATENELAIARDRLESEIEERTQDLKQEIAERKLIEDDLRLSEHEMKTIAEKFRNVIDSTPDAIFVIDITDDNSGKFVDVNDAACVNLGYPREELLKMSVPDIEVGVSQLERDQNYKILETQETSIMAGAHRRKDGTIFPISIRNKTFEDGERKYAVALVRDETEWQKIENDLRLAGEKAESARQEAEIANRTKSEFLANMSHELRTPLNAIIGFSETLSRKIFGPLGNEKQEEYIQNIHESGEHLLNLINDILDVSAIEADKLDLNEIDVDIEDVVSASVLLVKPRAEQGGIELINTINGHQLVIRADERRMKQILVNLLSNAVKFTKAGGTVTVSAEVYEDGSIGISIADTGIGMSAEDITQAMELFGQVHHGDSKDHEGTGLGLPLTKRLVEAQDGRLSIESEPGKGTTVKVRFPKYKIVNST